MDTEAGAVTRQGLFRAISSQRLWLVCQNCPYDLRWQEIPDPLAGGGRPDLQDGGEVGVAASCIA